MEETICSKDVSCMVNSIVPIGCTDGDMRPPRAENGVEGDGGVPILSLSAAVAQNDAAAMETPP